MTDFDWPAPVPPPERDPADYTAEGIKVESCRSCSYPIVWAVTTEGKSMPVDAPTDPAGNVVLRRDPPPVTSDRVYAIVLDQNALFDDGPRHLAHFVTCPDGDVWRSKRVGSR